MFEIDDKLFGYISKSGDLTEDIVQRYKNSLIFIGDEKQIYVPTTNSYVGVGTSTLEEIKTSISSSDKIYISDYANNNLTDPNTTYYFPVINNTVPHTYYHTYVALNVGVNPVSGKFIGGLQGTADYSNISHVSNTVKTISTTTQSSYYVSFVNKNEGDSYSYVTNKLLYDPGQEILTSTYFSGELLGHATSATYATYSTYTTYTSYSLFNSYQSIHNINTNGNYHITFSQNFAYSLSYIDNNLYYNPSTNCVYAGHFYGTFHGETDMFTDMRLGTISSYGNVLVHENTYIKIGNVEKSTGFSAAHIITYLDGDLISNSDKNLQMYVNINGIPINKEITYLHATYLGNVTKEGLFTQFENTSNQTTRITIGGTTKDLQINADKLDGFHANGLLQDVRLGKISSSGNTLTQENTYVKVGNTELGSGSSTANIINSHTIDTLSTSNTENLKIKTSVNGVPAEKSITYLHAYYLAGTKKEDLFTYFGDTSNQTTRITIGGTTKDLQINADKLDGFHANGLLQDVRLGKISSSGNTLTQENTYVKVGNTELGSGSSTTNIINTHTASGGQLSSDANVMSLSAHTDSVNGITSTIAKSTANIINSLNVTGNGLSSTNNNISLDPLTLNINGVSKSTTSSSAQIINSLSVSTLTSTNATNLTAAITINGVASANKSITDLIARQIAQTSITNLSTFTNANNLIYAAAGGSNSVLDKPTGVDAFGILSFKTADGWYGQLLMSSNESTGIYWRTATSLSGGWKKLLDSTNYTDYVYSKSSADNRYVLKTGDTMTGPLTINSSVNNNYNEGIRITRAANNWAGITFGSTGTSGAPTNGWFVATNPSNQFIINPDDSGNTAGLCLNKGGDLKWRNNNVAHAGNISNKDATIGTSLTEIATIAGVSIKAKIGNFSAANHTHSIKLGGTTITVPAPGTTPTATTSITGPLAIDTSADSTKAFSIRRTDDSEAVKHWVDDSEYHIDYTNDEKSSSIHWRIINTDTESPSNPQQTTDFHVYLDSSGAFHPGTNNTGSIGTASYKWKYIYGTNIYGDLTGNVTGNVSGNSGTSDKIKTVTNSTNANYYLTFVDSNNNPAAYESLYTNAGIIFNPYKLSLAQGATVTASGYCSHAEGELTTASGDRSHAEGNQSTSSGYCSHAEGDKTTASNSCARAEGSETTASGGCSHAEGYKTTASGDYAHAEGELTQAKGSRSHTSGYDTIANNYCESAFGKYNSSNSDTIFSVGIGTANNNRANAFEVTVNGLIKGYAGFYHCGIQSDNYVLTGAGGYKKWSEGYEVSTIVARNASGQIYCSHLNTTSNNMDSTAFTKVFVSDDNWIRYVTKDKFVEALREEDTVSFDKSLTVTEAWMDTGITTETGSGKNFPKGNGTYAVQISHGTLNNGSDSWPAIYSGIMTIYNGTNGSYTDEVILHRGGHEGGKRLYLRTIQTASSTGYCKIQIAASANFGANATLTFKFRKLI